MKIEEHLSNPRVLTAILVDQADFNMSLPQKVCLDSKRIKQYRAGKTTFAYALHKARIIQPEGDRKSLLIWSFP